MAGARKIWDSRKEALQNTGQRNFVEQNFGDGMLEFVSYRSEFQMGLERYISGRSSRLAQGPGPFLLNFRKTEQKTETYLQIDGEFYRVTNPKSLRIYRTGKIKGSQITVMVRNE
jgi:diacylglycerol kinase (ATP)